MNKSIIYGTILVMVIGLMACNNADEPEVALENSSIEQYLEVQVEEGIDAAPILSFDSYEAYKRTLDKLRSMDTDEARSEWVHSTYPEFTSIEDIYQKAGEEMAKIELETAESFNEFRHEYASLYFPMVDEDAGFYIPITDDVASFLANRDCKIIISNKVISLKDIHNYVDLQQTGKAYYEMQNSMKSPQRMRSEIPFYYTNRNMNSVGPEYDSGWHTYDKRRVKLKARRRFKEKDITDLNFHGSQSWFHTEFCFRKKTFFGWANYSCSSSMAITMSIPQFSTQTQYSNDSGTSSHDNEFLYPIYSSNDGEYWYNRFYEAPIVAIINFGDIDTPLTYSWNMPGIVCTTSISEGPIQIIPSNLF